jgi:DMSO/TMAO reductase YedYZ molybdopterin-dependent catalytic subunit
MKKTSLFLVALLVLALLAGCANTPPTDEPEESAWEFTIGDKDFTIEGLRKMESVTIDLEKKGEVNSYTGVPLSVLLTEAGIADFESLTLEAEDGYSASITQEEALHENSILCYALDGEDLSSEKNAPLMFVSEAASTKAWVGKLKYVRVGE